MINIPTFMVTVETKNYPVATIRPYIQRYSKIRKKMNASQIANCLAAFATVTLEKNNGVKIRLTANNFKQILIDYTNELKNDEIQKSLRAEARKNAEALEEFKEASQAVEAATEPEVTTTAAPVEETGEQVNEVEPDPEDEDTFDSTPFYTTDDE
jgi:predicted dinucleotide-binding enzyme